MRDADNSIRRKLAPFIDRMVTVSQKMSPMGNTPWWQQVPSTDDKMGYECDGKLGAPVAQDCANVEYTDMAPDDGTISVGAGVVKLLSSGQCPGNHERELRLNIHQVHAKSPSRPQRPSRSTGGKSAPQWTPSSTSASTPRSTPAPAATPTIGPHPPSAVGLSGENDRKPTTNSQVSGTH